MHPYAVSDNRRIGAATGRGCLTQPLRNAGIPRPRLPIYATIFVLQQQFDSANPFITHDLRRVERFCHRVIEMEEGKIVETQDVGDALTFSTDAGRMLQNAVLPAFPVRRSQKL